MFADDICVFYASVRGLQSILDVCQNLKTKSAKSTVIPLLTLGGQNVKLLTTANTWGLYWIPALR